MTGEPIPGEDSQPVPKGGGLRARFRLWRRSRPFWGGFWSFLGGAAIAAGPASAYKLLLASSTPVWLGIAVGLLVAIFGLFFWFTPHLRQIIGVLVVVLAVASMVTSDLGGFVIGMLMGIIGGALGFAWTPIRAGSRHGETAAPAPMAAPPPQ
jgi:uncharacterized protein DUF6114